MTRRISLPLVVMLGFVSFGCQPQQLQPVHKVTMPMAPQEDVLGKWMALDASATQPSSEPMAALAGPEFMVSIKFVSGPEDVLRKQGLLSAGSAPPAMMKLSSKDIDGIVKSVKGSLDARLLACPVLLVRNDQKAVARLGTEQSYIADLDLSGPLPEWTPIILRVPTGVMTTVRVREVGREVEVCELDGRTSALLGLRTCVARGGAGPVWHEPIALLGQAATKGSVTVGDDEAIVIPLQYRMHQTVASARASLRGPIKELNDVGPTENHPAVMIVQVRKVDGNRTSVATDIK